ncbi:MAG: DNA polymerase III subunit chi [Pseudomonadota bacterium]
MGAAFFYHLTERPLEATLPSLLTKSLAAGWRVAIRGPDRERLDALDRALWLGEGFLPHGMAGGPHDAEQPVLLTVDEPVNGATCLMAIDGVDISLDAVREMERVCVLFDAASDAVLETARGQWRMISDAGLTAQYWAEDGGRWVKKAESGD